MAEKTLLSLRCNSPCFAQVRVAWPKPVALCGQCIVAVARWRLVVLSHSDQLQRDEGASLTPTGSFVFCLAGIPTFADGAPQ